MARKIRNFIVLKKKHELITGVVQNGTRRGWVLIWLQKCRGLKGRQEKEYNYYNYLLLFDCCVHLDNKPENDCGLQLFAGLKFVLYIKSADH